MDPLEIASPKRADLYYMSPALPEIQAKAPNLIFSTQKLHSTNKELETEKNCVKDEDSEDKIVINFPFYKILPMKTRKTPKITLVLDLDETLVHSDMVSQGNTDHIFKIRVNQEIYNIYVCYRPGLFNFLSFVCGAFEVVIFTASMKAYAEQVLKEIDPKYLLRYKFYREACFEIDGNYIKDLRLLGRNLKHVVIIDNSAQAFSFQPDNGILISS